MIRLPPLQIPKNPNGLQGQGPIGKPTGPVHSTGLNVDQAGFLMPPPRKDSAENLLAMHPNAKPNPEPSA